MKNKLLLTLSLALACLTSITLAQGVVYFEDNFDGSPYSDNATLVRGPGNLDQGIWSTNNRNGGSTITTTSQYLSSGRSLMLNIDGTTPPSGTNQAQVVGRFSTDGNESIQMRDAMRIQFAFQVEEDTDAIFVVRPPSGTGVSEPVLIYLGTPGVRSHHADGNKVIVSPSLIETGQWYYLEVDLPDLALGLDAQYTTTVYNADKSVILGTFTGDLNSYPDNDGLDTFVFDYFSIYLASPSKVSTLYLDNISIYAIPESKLLATLLAIPGLLIIFIKRRSALLDK